MKVSSQHHSPSRHGAPALSQSKKILVLDLTRILIPTWTLFFPTTQDFLSQKTSSPCSQLPKLTGKVMEGPQFGTMCQREAYLTSHSILYKWFICFINVKATCFPCTSTSVINQRAFQFFADYSNGTKKFPRLTEKACNSEMIFFFAKLPSSQNTLFDTQTKSLSPMLNNSELFSVGLYCIC